MKSALFIIVAISLSFLFSCSSGDQKTDETTEYERKTNGDNNK